MKTNKTLITALAAVTLFSFAGLAPAQYKTVGDDGIAASPKLREMIAGRAGNSVAPAAVAAKPNHACPGCKDQYATRIDTTARGANKPTVLIAKHLCPSCGTAISTEGHGKAARDVVTHKCSLSDVKPASCCDAKKS